MTRVSFEFFPPREEKSLATLVDNVAGHLGQNKPEYFSVTYGAGGSTRDGTFETVSKLIGAGFDATPHLSIGADSDETICDLVKRYKDIGVKRIVTLRGDVPSGAGAPRITSNAESLVTLLRKNFDDAFELLVAAYPEVHPDAANANDDLDFFERKVKAGADAAITQYFYNPYAYLDFLERCRARGIDIPVYVGIMPITNFDSIVRFSAKAGADIPRWMLKKLEAMQHDDRAIRDFGIEVCSRLCEDLIQQGVPGFHFYTLNRWGATQRILDNLGL